MNDRTAEWPSVVVAFAYFFALMAGYAVMKPVRDQLGIAYGVDKLPWLFSGTFIAMLVTVPAFGALTTGRPRQRFVPITYHFFAAATILSWLLLARGVAPVATARAFFIWVSVYNLFVVSVFWSLMADLFTHQQGVRLFGIIAAGGSAGALTGPLLVEILVRRIGPTHLLLINAVFLELCVLCVGVLHRWSRGGQAEAPVGGDILSGIRVVFQSPFLLALCGYIVLLTTTATFLYFAQARIVAQASVDPKIRTLLFARIDLVVNVTTLVVQGFVTSRVVRRLGVRFGIALLPVLTAAGFVALALAPTLVVIAVVQGLRRAAHYGLERPSREILYTSISREQKYKSKNFIDTVVYRGGDALSGWLSAALQSTAIALAASVGLCALWLWNSLFLGRSDEERAGSAVSAGIAKEVP